MAITINCTYEGGLICKAVHEPSGKTVKTDAPIDNHGKGSEFSPTDLVATALGACYLTLMGIQAEQHDVILKGTTAKVEKHMSEDAPRRIAKLVVEINFCKGIPLNRRGLLEAVAINCPTAKSLHPEINIEYLFNFPD
jgi:putative redox protein